MRCLLCIVNHSKYLMQASLTREASDKEFHCDEVAVQHYRSGNGMAVAGVDSTGRLRSCSFLVDTLYCSKPRIESMLTCSEHLCSHQDWLAFA